MKQKRLPAFSERIYALRDGRSQEEFAQFLGISRPTLGAYEIGNRVPDAVTLKRIAEKCEVSVDYLLGLTDYTTKDAETITAQGMGLTEETAKYLQFMQYQGDSTPSKMVSLMVDSATFASFARELNDFVYEVKRQAVRFEEMGPLHIESEYNELRKNKFFISDEFNNLLNELAPLPDIEKKINEAWKRKEQEYGKHKRND